jgi:hypothetical protein
MELVPSSFLKIENMSKREAIIRIVLFDIITLGAVYVGFFETSQKLFYGIMAGLATLTLGLLNILVLKR